MTEFDKLLTEEYRKRTISRTELYPRKINLSREFTDALEMEYYSDDRDRNRNFHSNFLKAISFECDLLKDNPELAAKYVKRK